MDQITEFRPRKWLCNAHAQTIAGNFLPRKDELPAAEERLFSVEKDVEVLCHCHWQAGQAKHAALTVIIVHGLEGSSASQYVVGTGNKAWRCGWNVVRMNMRNCGGTERLTPSLYHSGMSADVGAGARILAEEDGLRHIAMAGYSMGGNLVMKLAGEWGNAAPREVVAFAGVSPAMDLSPSADALNDRGNRLYQWKFMRGLLRRYRRKAALFPEVYDLARARGLRSVREFDDVITAPYSGFTDAEDYYNRSSASRLAERIAVPTLVLHAQDDPFIRLTEESRNKLLTNKKVTFVETAHGGHCAFLEDTRGDYDGRWAEQLVIEFFARQMARRQQEAG